MRKSIYVHSMFKGFRHVGFHDLTSNAKSVAPKTVGLVRRIDESDAAVVDFEGTGGGRTIYLNKGLSQQSLNPTRQLTFVKEKLWMKPGEQMGV